MALNLINCKAGNNGRSDISIDNVDVSRLILERDAFENCLERRCEDLAEARKRIEELEAQLKNKTQ